MRLSRKMNNALDVIFLKDLVDGLCVADICLDERIVVSVLNVLQVLEVARIGKLIYIDDSFDPIKPAPPVTT